MQERLVADLKQALLAKDSRAVSVLRMLKSELHNAQISSGKELDEAESQIDSGNYLTHDEVKKFFADKKKRTGGN